MLSFIYIIAFQTAVAGENSTDADNRLIIQVAAKELKKSEKFTVWIFSESYDSITYTVAAEGDLR